MSKRREKSPPPECGMKPLFALYEGSPACTALVLAFGEEVAAAIGEDPGQFDSYSLGIRGGY